MMIANGIDISGRGGARADIRRALRHWRPRRGAENLRVGAQDPLRAYMLLGFSTVKMRVLIWVEPRLRPVPSWSEGSNPGTRPAPIRMQKDGANRNQSTLSENFYIGIRKYK